MKRYNLELPVLHFLEWVWLGVGILAILDGIVAKKDSWRSLLFGFGILTFVLVDRMTPPVPSGSQQHLDTTRMAAACLQAIGLALSIPTFAKGRFSADRDLANEFTVALLAVLIMLLLGLLNVTAWNTWLPLPASLWLMSVVPRWLRRLYWRNEKIVLACAASLWALTCLVCVTSGWWQVKPSPAIGYFLLAALTMGSVAYITYGGPARKPPGDSAPA